MNEWFRFFYILSMNNQRRVRESRPFSLEAKHCLATKYNNEMVYTVIAFLNKKSIPEKQCEIILWEGRRVISLYKKRFLRFYSKQISVGFSMNSKWTNFFSFRFSFQNQQAKQLDLFGSTRGWLRIVNIFFGCFMTLVYSVCFNEIRFVPTIRLYLLLFGEKKNLMFDENSVSIYVRGFQDFYWIYSANFYSTLSSITSKYNILIE